jgi:predicted enzyme related to lactoylglutathione lyase
MQAASPDEMAAPASGPGEIVWWELVTGDPPGAEDFYNKVVGWGSHQIDMNGRPYWLWTKAGEEGNPGGMMERPSDYDGPAFWLFYIWVDDVDAVTARVNGLGGKVLMDPQDVPGQGRMSVINSPSGAQIALFTPASMPG